jgi:hypothetical protein
MRLETAFRLSFYITLGLACACLAQAEVFFLTWFPYVCLPLAGMVFALAWRHEGRWIIQQSASNYLGIFIGLATGGWILLQMPRSNAEILSSTVPWPAGLLPHLGLLLLVLLAVKLFRPKMLSDFWVIQTMGMMMVTLGCVLAGDLLFAALLLVYLASFIWCLALFQLYRAGRPAGPGRLFNPHDAAPMPALVPWRHLGITRAMRWSLAVVAVGLPVFMLMPRSTNQQWMPQKLTSANAASMYVGVDSGINLNRVGTIELSPDPAFHVNVTDADGKAARLSTNTLWRVEVLDYYKSGQWMNWPHATEFFPDLGDIGAPPDIKPQMPATTYAEQRLLGFRVHASKAGGLPLAEPVDIRYVGLDPILGREPPTHPLFQPIPGADSVKCWGSPARKAMYRYKQVLTGADNAERIPARFYEDAYGDYIAAQQVPDRITLWARQWLSNLRQLTPAQRRLDEHGHIAAQNHAAVSIALCRHFALGGEYRYSLTLKRQQRALDPIADFLLNVKTGHCERFASALALALRSLGVPSRVIKGYRGADEEHAGEYVVRQDQAHSWVQVLVRDGEGWAWLTLDPTPGDGDVTNPLTGWFGWLRDLDPEQLWRRYVLNYNGEVQSAALVRMGQGITGKQVLWPMVGAVVALAYMGWRRSRLQPAWRRRDAMTASPDFYRRLLRVLGRRFGLRPAVGQTPLEFAGRAAAALRRQPATAAWAELPLQAAHGLYRLRFAGSAISPVDAAALTAQVTALERAARAVGRRKA